MNNIWQKIKANVAAHQTYEAVLEHLGKHYQELRENRFLLRAAARCGAEINQQIAHSYPTEEEDLTTLFFEAKLMHHPRAILNLGSYYLQHKWDFHSLRESENLEVVRFVVHMPPMWRLFPTPIAYHEVSTTGKDEGTYFSGSFKAPLQGSRGLLRRILKKKYRLPDASYRVVTLPAPTPLESP